MKRNTLHILLHFCRNAKYKFFQLLLLFKDYNQHLTIRIRIFFGLDILHLCTSIKNLSKLLIKMKNKIYKEEIVHYCDTILKNDFVEFIK